MVNTITNKFIIISLVFFLLPKNILAEETAAVEKVESNTTENKLNQTNKKNAASKSVNRLSLGAVTWGEQILLQTSDGRSANVVTEYTGLALGYEISYSKKSLGYHFGIQGLFLGGQAQSEGTNIVYKNKIDLMTPFLLDAGLQFYPTDNVWVGLSSGVMYSNLKLVPPTSIVTSYNFQYLKTAQLLAQLKLGWMLSEKWFFQQTLFVAEQSLSTPGWTVLFGYTF